MQPDNANGHDNVALFRNPNFDWLEEQAREAYVTLSVDMARLRLSLEAMDKSEILIFRAKACERRDLNLDNWRALQAMLEIVGGVMATRPDLNPELFAQSNVAPFTPSAA